MPDQDTAATEHALIREITEPLASLPDDPVSVAADRDFPMALRGYDRIAVDAYVAKTSQLIAELQATRSPESAVRRALERVGEEVSGVLKRAHDTADELTRRSRSEAEERLERARAEAEEIKAGAVQAVKDLDAETDRIWAERHRIVEDIEDLSRRLVSLAESAAARFPPEDTGSEPAISEADLAGADGIDTEAAPPFDHGDELGEADAGAGEAPASGVGDHAAADADDDESAQTQVLPGVGDPGIDGQPPAGA